MLLLHFYYSTTEQSSPIYTITLSYYAFAISLSAASYRLTRFSIRTGQEYALYNQSSFKLKTSNFWCNSTFYRIRFSIQISDLRKALWKTPSISPQRTNQLRRSSSSPCVGRLRECYTMQLLEEKSFSLLWTSQAAHCRHWEVKNLVLL